MQHDWYVPPDYCGCPLRDPEGHCHCALRMHHAHPLHDDGYGRLYSLSAELDKHQRPRDAFCYD